MRQFYIMEKWISLEKVIGYCFFGPAPRCFIMPEEVVESVRLAAGWEMDVNDLLEIGERATNMARVFNAREGFSKADDALPERLYQGLENGALAGESIPREEFQEALTTLYKLKGWDPETGHPTPQRLEALSLEWAADLF
jgi:aldehyde:ferredoxin oxidoreductase